MEYKQETILIWKIFVCLLFFIININRISANSEPKIISTQNEIIAYVNHTAKLSCIIQNRNQRHIKIQVTWSRVHFMNETQKLINLLYVDLLKYTSLNRYHLTHLVDKDNRDHLNLEIRQIHLSDQGYYSCFVTAIKPISEIFHLKVIDNTRNVSLALRSTLDIQQEKKEEINSLLSLINISISNIFLMIILILII
ncbi:unnamed protein product [Rotaria sordida]|uniref:Ig-like domain-containing protein n=1 Tax=Rotaria sordida TaxID=392033 RepID=A0A814JNY9_9BILA|nr:unnamed protein product [Rotaria sordida]CAF1039769.1 unnamed protein product [Rotaria sordida]